MTRGSCLFSVLAFAALLPLCSAEEAATKGLVHVQCEPGSWIVWDGAIAGQSSEAFLGYVVSGVAPGEYQLRVYRFGSARRDATVKVPAGGGVTLVQMPEAKPRVSVTQGVAAKELPALPATGSALVSSQPADGCSVSFPARGWEELPIPELPLLVGGLEEGVYEITFKRQGKERTHTFLIDPIDHARANIEFDWDGKAAAALANPGVAKPAAAKPTAATGHLMISSNPAVCKIDFPFLGWKDMVKKTEGAISPRNLPVGTYSMTFKRLDESLSVEVAVEAGKTTYVHADWEKKAVQTRSADSN